MINSGSRGFIVGERVRVEKKVMVIGKTEKVKKENGFFVHLWLERNRVNHSNKANEYIASIAVGLVVVVIVIMIWSFLLANVKVWRQQVVNGKIDFSHLRNKLHF